MSRTTIFLSVLSAAIVSLALLANATGFGPGVGAAVPGQHADRRGDRGRRHRGGDRRPGRADGRGGYDQAVAAGTMAFLVVWTALFALERHALDPLRRTTPRFPTPPGES
jgi:hypothetical protein